MKKKKQSKADFIRSWNIQSPPFQYNQLRYKNPPEKGIYWYWFSLEVRHRDVEKYGTCISCGKPITVKTSQAGHYIPASSCGRNLLFDPRNINAECPRCNGFDGGHLFGYEKNLCERYGEDIVSDLKRRYFEYKDGGPLKDFKGKEYAEKIKALNSYQQSVQHK